MDKPNINCDCGKIIEKDHIYMNKGIAHCPECNIYFDIQDDRGFIIKRKELKKVNKTPQKVKLTKDHNSIEIVFNWGNIFSYIQVLIGCLFGIGISYGLIQSVSSGDIPSTIGSLIFFCFLAFILFVQLRFSLNKTTITITKDLIKGVSGPLPSKKGNFTIKTEDIDQIYSSEGSAGRYGKIVLLNLIDKKGVVTTLLNSLYNIEEARFIENEIESFLGIEDKFVKDEYLEPMPWDFRFVTLD